MSLVLGLTNLALGTVYTSYGIMTIIDLKRGWRSFGFSHFGAAWIAMAFTCGPHHLVHGLHTLEDGRDGALDIFVVVAGIPAGVAWFLMRLEALSGGRGDRTVAGTPPWVAAQPAIAVVYTLVVAAAAAVVLSDGATFTARMAPNLLLLFLYSLIGFYLVRTQLANRAESGGWSLSGLSLSVVFPTCGIMHAVYLSYVAVGRYELDWHGLVIDWLAVPAAVYFVWVVRMLHTGQMSDWNRAAADARVPVAVA